MKQEISDVFHAHWKSYLKTTKVTKLEMIVANAVMRCRTALLGGHLYQCESCKHKEQSYNSCRNRHCPKCQGHKAAEWVNGRESELLPVQYFHTVFTLPHALNQLVLLNKKLMYEILFQAVSQTLIQVGKTNLQCQLGFFSLLHTWGQSLSLHPHLHVVIPGVGISLDGSRVIKLKKKRYLICDKILSSVFCGKFVELLKNAYKAKKLQICDESDISNPNQFEKFIDTVVRSKWVVRTKPPFAGPKVVLKYLARYTHRVAIGNSRIISVTDKSVSFSYKDYRENDFSKTQKTMTLSGAEFIRRFLLHTLPLGFVRVRYYGFLTASKKAKALCLIRDSMRQLVDVSEKVLTESKESLTNTHSATCTKCKVGVLVYVCRILRVPFGTSSPPFISFA